MTLKKIFIFSMMLLMALPAVGLCLEVTAQVDKTRISMEDSVFLTVTVTGGKADLDLSMIKQFKVIPRGSTSSYNYINGTSERTSSNSYVLVPLEKGELRIPAIMATRDKETALTREIVIHVTDQVVADDDVRSLFAKAEMTKQRLFEGEQAVYTLTFFTSKRLSGLGFERPPDFKTLASKPFEKEKSYTQTLNGVLYQVTQVNYLITPAAPGTFTIDPAVLMANVMVKSKRDARFDSFFNDSFFSSNSYKPVRVVSNPVTIEVVPLPPYPGREKFSGLVGRFTIEGTVDRTRLKAGESATLTLKISGSGNIMDAGLPEIALPPDDFKVYDDTPAETIQLTKTGYEGFKLFKKALVPVNPGRYVIPPVTLVYFDGEKKAYQTISTQEIRLDVTPSGEQHQAAAPSALPTDTSIVKQSVFLVNKDILDIKEDLSALKDYREIKPLFFVLYLLIPAIFFSGVKWFTRVSRKEIPIERQMEEKARFHLKQAQKKGPQEHGFLGHLYSALVATILARAKKKGETVTLSEARTILAAAHVDDSKIDQITGLLETIESVRFGGRLMDGEKAKALLSKTAQMMKLICLVLVCLGLFSLAPQRASADSAAAFLDGVKSYKAGHFKQAAIEFETIAENKVTNPYLFYNIANAYLKAGDIGHAILWYERAKVLSPNDPDLNFNLAYANTLVKDKKDDAVTLMDVLFFWDRLVSAKTIQMTALFFSFVFFAWAAVRVVKNQTVFSGAGIILCSLLLLLTAITCADYYVRYRHLGAVIVGEEVAVRSGMAETSTKLFTLHAGSKVDVETKKNGHLKILFSKGKVGWIKAGDARMI